MTCRRNLAASRRSFLRCREILAGVPARRVQRAGFFRKAAVHWRTAASGSDFRNTSISTRRTRKRPSSCFAGNRPSWIKANVFALPSPSFRAAPAALVVRVGEGSVERIAQASSMRPIAQCPRAFGLVMGVLFPVPDIYIVPGENDKPVAGRMALFRSYGKRSDRNGLLSPALSPNSKNPIK